MAASCQSVEETVSGILARRPVLSPVLQAFAPLLAARAALPEQLKPLLESAGIRLPEMQRERAAQGYPLLAEIIGRIMGPAVTLVDAGAAAAAELLTTLIPEMGAKITPEIASCLYTGVATDTGCFRFSNTTAETHKAAAALIEAGADVERLNERLFESRSHARVIAERMALESLEFYYDDRCALICLTWDQIQAAGVAGAELEDLTSLPRSIEGVEVGLTLRQQKDGSFKISVRTGHDTNACNIARRLGGGGHPRAAGCEISGNPDNAKHAILEEVKKELDRADAEKEPQ